MGVRSYSATGSRVNSTAKPARSTQNTTVCSASLSEALRSAAPVAPAVLTSARGGARSTNAWIGIVLIRDTLRT